MLDLEACHNQVLRAEAVATAMLCRITHTSLEVGWNNAASTHVTNLAVVAVRAQQQL